MVMELYINSDIWSSSFMNVIITIAIYQDYLTEAEVIKKIITRIVNRYI